jgi:hypothetical protein
MQMKYYALGLLINPKYREPLISTAKSGKMVAIAYSSNQDKSSVFFSMHPELDLFYFEFIHGALIHSLDGERLLRNMRQRTKTSNTADIGYENRWFRMAKEDFSVDALKNISPHELLKLR